MNDHVMEKIAGKHECLWVEGMSKRSRTCASDLQKTALQRSVLTVQNISSGTDKKHFRGQFLKKSKSSGDLKHGKDN